MEIVLQGEGYHCVSDACERQCSTGGDDCVAVAEVTDALCMDAFAWAKTSHVCIPAGDVSTQVRCTLILRACLSNAVIAGMYVS